MALPVLTPASLSNKSILPPTGSAANVTTSSLPFGIYVSPDHWTTDQTDMFRRGASEQVSFVYKKLGGDILDIELVDYLGNTVDLNGIDYSITLELCETYSSDVKTTTERNALVFCAK